MKNTTWVVWTPFLAAAVLAGPACKKKDADKPAEKVVSNEKKEAPPEPAKPVGLADPSNDPKIVEAAKKVLTDCAKTMEEKSGSKTKNFPSCDKFREDFGDLKFEKSAPTFVNFLDDADVRVRSLGLIGMHRMGYEWKEDKALAGRVVAALKKEKAPSPIDHEWGYRITNIETDVGVDDQIKAIEMDPNTSMDTKTAIMAWWKSDAGYDAVKANAASTDPAMMSAVVQGYGVQFEKHADEACAYWADHLETPDSATNEMAIGHLTGGWIEHSTKDTESDDSMGGTGGGPSERNDKRCKPEQLGKALDLVEKKFADKAEGEWMPRALGFVANDKLSPKDLKDRAVKDLKAMVEKKGYFPGQEALRQLNAGGDPAMVKYAQKFVKDPDLGDTAKGIVEDAKQKKSK
jgi:hypothetical protein